jgi:hypothetical protein
MSDMFFSHNFHIVDDKEPLWSGLYQATAAFLLANVTKVVEGHGLLCYSGIVVQIPTTLVEW